MIKFKNPLVWIKNELENVRVKLHMLEKIVFLNKTSTQNAGTSIVNIIFLQYPKIIAYKKVDAPLSQPRKDFSNMRLTAYSSRVGLFQITFAQLRKEESDNMQ